MWQYRNTDELYHYGVKGMKWGYHKPSAADKRQVDDVKTAGKTLNASSSGFQGGSKIAGEIGNLAKPSKKVQREMSQMSDAELRNKINRQTMEQQYAALNPSKVKRGAAVAKSVIEIAGGVAAIAGSAATIYAAMKSARWAK